nr:glycosyltransferase [Flavobacterium sp. Sd200]
MGHATRCIPVIDALENHGFEPIIASDGTTLELLKKEFPHLKTIELPGYHAEYAKTGAFFKLKILLQMPRMFLAIRHENKLVCNIVKEHNLAGIISDSRLGAYCKNVPTVFLTHQLNILSGSTTALATKIHQYFLRRFTQCWVPDVETSPNLSGKLGHTEDPGIKPKYIGLLSRLHKKTTEKQYSLMVLLSGGEPQRTELEEKLRAELKKYNGKTLFVQGLIEPEQKMVKEGNTLFYNYMNTAQIEEAMNQSEVVLCRPSYTNVMDLAKLCKKAFFIPVPGEYEQEYLAKKLKRSNTVPYALQDNFKIKNLGKAHMYKGLKSVECAIKWKDLFSLFESK